MSLISQFWGRALGGEADSILDGKSGGGSATEVHTMVASVMMGLLATRVLLRQPVQISFEEEHSLSLDTEQIAAHDTLVMKLDPALKAKGHDSSDIGGLTVAYTPTYDTTTTRTRHVGITGRSGGASLERSPSALDLRRS